MGPGQNGNPLFSHFPLQRELFQMPRGGTDPAAEVMAAGGIAPDLGHLRLRLWDGGLYPGGRPGLAITWILKAPALWGCLKWLGALGLEPLLYILVGGPGEPL